MTDIAHMPPLVARLLQANATPNRALIEQLCRHTDSVLPAVRALAANVALLREREPRCYAPLHALRLLPAMPHPDNVSAVLHCLPLQLDEASHVAAVRWARDSIGVLVMHGRVALPVLWAWVDDDSSTTPQRGAALEALLSLAQGFPATRAEIATGISARFTAYLAAHAPDTLYMTFLAHTVVGMQLCEHYTALMGAYKAGYVDRALLPAAVARQAMYGQADSEPFVPLTFWERYTQDHDEVNGDA